jgi:predicted O-linked N-acetylglucosamine transferase (SPINDLY family)
MKKSKLSGQKPLLQQAIFQHQSGNIIKAIELYRLLIKQYPKNPQLFHLLGTAEAERGNFLESLYLFGKSLKMYPNNPEAHYNRGFVFHELERFDEALQSYDRAIQLKPDYPEAHNNRGIVLRVLKRFDEALQSYDRAIQLKPDHPEAHCNRGVALQDLKRFEEALQSYERTIQLKPDYSEAHNNRGIVFHELKRFDEALQSYDRAIQLKPDYPKAHNSRGVALRDLYRFEEALQSYDRAIQLKPDHPEAYYNRGVALQELKRFDEALQSYDCAIQLKPDYPETHYNRGNVLKELKRFDEALQSYDRAIQLKPDNDFWLGDWFYVKRSCCDWDDYETRKYEIVEGLVKDKKLIEPLVTILMTDSLELQKQSAKIWVTDKFSSSNPASKTAKYTLHDKIHIGYFSADFRDHAVTHVIVEMLEKHDRSRFELYGFSFGPESNDPWKKRIQQCFDQFLDVRFQSDQDIAQLARNLEIDIAVDLMGFTSFSRSNIFAGRAAPVQVNYLGFPGTMGAGFIDYIVADKTIIPESDRHHYTEKVVYLPDSYLANCRNRDVSQEILTRVGLNLPQDGFVFCCFNNSSKITPTMFDSWMRILRQVDESVLWLSEGNRWAVDNLRMEAEKRGVNADRLVFAKKLPLIEDHLNRIRHADLFLDNLPYNAHSTASDALRMGVPLVTLTGNAFAGRVAASLLNTLDLGELITYSSEEYEKIAVDLASNRDRLQRIKDKLNVNVQTSPRFDSDTFTRHIEKAYELMYERCRNDLAPDHIVV